MAKKTEKMVDLWTLPSWTLEEAASLYRITVATLRKHCVTGSVEAHQAGKGGKWRVTKAAMDKAYGAVR